MLSVQDWRRRFFILKGSRLFFAKTPYEAPHGMIDLSRCTTVKSADLKSHKKHSFEISTPETTYLLYAGEEQGEGSLIFINMHLLFLETFDSSLYPLYFLIFNES